MGRFITIEDALEHNAAHADDRAAVAHDLTVRRGAVGADTRLGAQGGLLPRVFDLHCDTLDRLALSGDPVAPGGFYERDANVPRERMSSLRDNDAHISLERTAEFDWCQCFAVFIPDELRGMDAWRFYERVRNWWKAELQRESGSLSQVRSAVDLYLAFETGKTAGVLTIEGAAFLSDDGTCETMLDQIAQDGVRMCTLTWNGANALGSGNLTSEGLTGFGRSMVRELEAREIIVDVSHLNDEGFKDVCKVAEKPFVASHSNARSICAHPRNLADWQLREIADRGGVVGLNFCRDFLTDLRADPSESDVLRHIDHVLEVAGERVLALGSDYDGCDVPSWLDPCDRLRDLRALITREFGEEVAELIMFENARSFLLS